MDIIKIDPIDVIVETENPIESSEMKKLLDLKMFNITVIPDKIRKLCSKFQIQTVTVNNEEYEYMLSHDPIKEMPIDRFKNNLEIQGFNVTYPYICSSNNIKIAKYNVIGRYIGLPRNTNILDMKLIFAIPGSFTVFLDNYSIRCETLKELLFCGQKEVNFKYWRKNE